MIDNNFTIINVLGQGGSSKVFLAEDTLYNKYAIKVIRSDRKFAKAAGMKMLAQEHNLLQQFADHPNVIKSLNVSANGVVTHQGESESIMYNVLEYAPNGALSEYIRYCGPMEETLVPFLIKQLCCAVGYVHSKQIAHLDLKLENILMDSFFNVKLADFGSAISVADTKGEVQKKRGTLLYMAPEVANHKSSESYNGFAADVYSLGICLFLLLLGEFPSTFGQDLSSTTVDSERKESEQEIKIENPILGQCWNYLSEEVRDLINRMTHPDPCKRATIEEVLSHPWLNQENDEELHSSIYQEMSARKAYIKEVSS